MPSGLHYRINLSTGKKEAKTLSNEEEETQSNKNFMLVEESEEVGNQHQSDDIEKLLKNVDKKNPETDMPKKFRTLDELHKELDDINLFPKSDVEIMQELFNRYEEESKKLTKDYAVILDILHNLKYLGHQIDNGNEFYKMDGFRKIIYKELNSTNPATKLVSLKLFSVLAQNNPKVKIHILETGGVTILLRTLSLEENDGLKKSALTALSCTLRTFPYAQNKFIEIGGLKMFAELFKNSSVKLKLKIVTLLNDLIVERQEDNDHFEHHKVLDIESALYELNWCGNLNKLLHDLVVIDINDFDSIEKCLLAMKSLIGKCKMVYQKELIGKLKEQYDLLAKINQEESDNYFQYLSNLTSTLLQEGTATSKEEL